MELVHHIVVDHVALVLLHLFRLSVVHTEQIVAEGWDHEELLHHAVHVADATKVAQANVLLCALSRVGLRSVAPGIGLLDGDDERHELSVEELLHEGGAVLDELVEELVGGLSTFDVGGSGSLSIRASSDLLMNHHSLAIYLGFFSLEVRCKEELTEYLTYQVLLFDNSVAYFFISLGNNFAGEGNESDKQTFLLSSKF